MQIGNINKLEQEINELIDMYKNCNVQEEKIKIHLTLIMLLQILNEKSNIYYSEFFKYVKTTYDVQNYARKALLQQLSQTYTEEYENIISQIIKNCEMHSQNFKYSKFPQIKTFTIDEAKQIIIDFINEFDKNLIPIITKALSEEHLFINLEPHIGFTHNTTEGFCCYNNYSKSSYIFVDNGYKGYNKISFNTLSTIVHELGHVISFYLNFQFAKTSFSNFVEVPSCTFDYLFLMYILKKNIEIEDTEVQINSTINLTLLHIQSLKKLTSKKISLENLGYSDFNSLNNKPYKYSFGHLLSFYYSKSYQQDPEKTRYNIYEFMKNIGIKDDMYMLSHFGIDKEEFISCESFKEAVDRNQKVLLHLKQEQQRRTVYMNEHFHFQYRNI